MERFSVRWFRHPLQWLMVDGRVIVIPWRKTPWMLAHEREDMYGRW